MPVTMIVRRMVVSLGGREWLRPLRKHEVPVRPAVVIAMHAPSVPVREADNRTVHYRLTVLISRRRARDERFAGRALAAAQVSNPALLMRLLMPAPALANVIPQLASAEGEA